MKRFISALAPALDLALAPLVWVAALILKGVRRFGVQKLTVCRSVLRTTGVFPVRLHYYEPLTDPKTLRKPLDEPRHLPGVDLNTDGQLALLSRFHYQEELLAFPKEPRGAGEFHYHNHAFGSGDAELLYSMIRHFKPSRIIEVGSGSSTLIARAAIERNHLEDEGRDRCRQTCIEPYEHPWLTQLDIELVRERVERVNPAIFGELGENDILFIDSSHIVRPQGDVLCEYLELLPTLCPGVLVHVHDIFTPRDYPAAWVVDQVRFWNEQYLLEAFLSHNGAFQVVAAANFLAHDHPEAFRAAFPVYASERPEREPGSFWMVRSGAEAQPAPDTAATTCQCASAAAAMR